jgi:hypothetical protein
MLGAGHVLEIKCPEISRFCGTRTFITMFTKALHILFL